MGFQEAVQTVLSKYATFTGRAARPEFWWFMLFVFIVNIVTGILDGVLFNGQVLNTIAMLALLLPQLAVGVRRLHDIDRSGWWMLLALIPVVGWVALIYFNVQPSYEGDTRRDTPAPEVGRVLLLSLVGGVIGLGVGYLTSPIEPNSVYLTQVQADHATQVGGLHLLVSIVVGLATGLIIGFVLNAIASTRSSGA